MLAANTTLTVSGVTNFGANPGSGVAIRTLSALNLNAGGVVNLLPSSSKTNRTVLVTSGLKFAGNNTGWQQGRLDLSNNDVIVKNGISEPCEHREPIESGIQCGRWLLEQFGWNCFDSGRG